MRRKYDIRNKRNFIIIAILAIMVIIVFSLFIYRYMHSSKIEYAVEVGSILQDENKNFINVEEDATLKMRWNDNYYLIYQDKKINLGKKVIVYNPIDGSMHLYGKFYEIDETGKVVINDNETTLANTTTTKFYKLDDRKYLLIDRQIASDDRSIEASNYLLVELDKMGNAKLSNNKLNLKTINPTTLVTSAYSFDINNESLKYGNKTIDLKKIIGSSNQYKEKKTEEEKNGGSGALVNGEGNNTWNSNVGPGNIINNNDTGNVEDMGEIKDRTKMSAIVRIQESLTQIDVDYVIYDPYNEYKSVYAEIIKPGKVDVVYLSKTDTHIVFEGLIPNTTYRINFVYTTEDSETKQIVINTFESVNLTTKMPVYSVSPYKISNVTNKLTYKVNLQEGYVINKVNVTLSFNYNNETVKLNSSVDVASGDKSVIGSFDITNYDIDKNTLLTLTIESVEGTNGTLNIGSVYTFRLGR